MREETVDLHPQKSTGLLLLKKPSEIFKGLCPQRAGEQIHPITQQPPVWHSKPTVGLTVVCVDFSHLCVCVCVLTPGCDCGKTTN